MAELEQETLEEQTLPQVQEDLDVDEVEDDEVLPPDPDEMPVRRIFNTPYHYFYGALGGYGIGLIGTGLLGILGVITEEASSSGSMASWALALVGAGIGHFRFKKEEAAWKASREQDLKQD